jgi:hypothetical protein
MKKFPISKCQVVITLVEISKEERFKLKTLCPFQTKEKDLDLKTPTKSVCLQAIELAISNK